VVFSDSVCQPLPGAVHDALHIQRPGFHFRLAHRGKQEQPADDVAHLAPVPCNRAQVVAHFLAGQGGVICLHRLGEADDEAEGVLDIVGHGVGERVQFLVTSL